MRFITRILLLMLLVLLSNSIELNKQPKIRESMGPPPPRLMPLPPPYYYNEYGEIRAKGHPNALPVMAGDYFSGMTNGNIFFPIVLKGKFYIFDLRKHKHIEMSQTDMIAIRESAETYMNRFSGNNTFGASSSSSHN